MVTMILWIGMIAGFGFIGLYVVYHFEQENGAAAGLTFRQWLWPFLRSLPGRWRDRGGVVAGVPAPAGGPPPADSPPAPGPAPLPRPPASLPPAVAAPPGAPSAGGAQSDLLYAVDALVGEASHGDLMAVRRVVGTLAEAMGGIGSALVRLSTRLAEPDKDYGAEIWEPIATAGGQANAAGLHLGESDAHALSLIGMAVGELAQSARRAPHSSQLNGGA